MNGTAAPPQQQPELESAESGVEITTVDYTLVITETTGGDVVEIHDGGPDTLLITEPVSVDPGSMGLELDDLADADGFATAPTETPLVLYRGADGVLRPTRVDAIAHTHWGEEIRFGEGDPAEAAPVAPHGATFVDYVTGTIYQAREST